MKICYDPQVFSFQTYGGVSRYFCEIAKIISDSKGANIKIVAPFYVCEYLRTFNPNQIIGFRAPHLDPLKFLFRLWSMALGHIYLLWLDPDIIHETYFFPYALGSKRAKRVLTVYDMIHEKFPEANFSQNKASQYKAIAVQRADHVICISEATKQDLIALFGVDPQKISVIYLGHSLTEQDQQQQQQQQHQLNHSSVKPILPRQYLLYVGKRDEYKNFKSLLQAFALSKELHECYDLVCFGADPINPREIEMCHQLGISPSKIIHRAGSDEVLSQLYTNASAFIYPSLYEGFGLPPLEAMHHDCPVICSNAGSIPEVVGDAGEYFDPNDIEDIKNAMHRVLFDPDRGAQLTILGRQRIKLFSWERCAAQTLELYQKMVLNT